VQNVLLIMPWLMERGYATIDEIAEQFDLAREVVIEDLFTASFCGVPPYSPLELTDIYVSEDYVTVGRRKTFNEQLRLTESESVRFVRARGGSARTSRNATRCTS